MLATVKSHNGVASLPTMLKESCSYSISRFIVSDGGLGVNPRFHILLDEFAGVRELSLPFVDRVFNLRCPSDVPGGNFSSATLVGTCFYFLYMRSTFSFLWKMHLIYLITVLNTNIIPLLFQTYVDSFATSRLLISTVLVVFLNDSWSL